MGSTENPTVSSILLEWLRNNGYDGLCCPDAECGCGIDSLFPCDGPFDTCIPAYRCELDDDRCEDCSRDPCTDIWFCLRPEARRECSPPLDSIICCDALKALEILPPECVHLIITSPPYNLAKPYAGCSDDLEYGEYLDKMRLIWTAAERVLVSGGRICINIGENKRQNISYPTYSAFIQQLVDLKMLYRGTVIWNKNSAAKHCAWGSWKSCSNPHIVPRHEYIIIFSKGEWKLEGDPKDCDLTADEFMETTRSVWQFGTESKKRIGHPAPFPEKLPERLIKYYSYRSNVVLDMFAGSGTVGVVAARLGRHYVLIDNSIEYCELAKKRLAQAGNATGILVPRQYGGFKKLTY